MSTSIYITKEVPILLLADPREFIAPLAGFCDITSPFQGDALSHINDTDAGLAPFEIVADYACEASENPLWHEQEQRLYWTDIPGGRLFRCDPKSGKRERCYEGRPVGGFTIPMNGSLALFMYRGTVTAEEKEKKG